MVNNLQVGSEIEVIATDNVLRRFPHLIGVHGVIETTPVHPNIWYTIYFKCLDATLKLQQNAVKLWQKKTSDKSKSIAKVSSSNDKPKEILKSNPNSQTKIVSKKNSKGSNKIVKLQENNLQLEVDSSEVKKVTSAVSSPSHCVVPVSYLKVGTKVIILGTDNVQQRVPQLEGNIGTIKEAPGII